MNTAIIIACIFIILFILITQTVIFRIKSDGRLTLTVSFTVFAFEFTNFKNKKKKKKRISICTYNKALKFILQRAKVDINDVSVSAKAPPHVRALITAALSLIFAYSDSITDKISIKSELGVSDLPFTFDVSVKARFYVFALAFIILKIKNFGRKKTKCLKTK